MQFENEEIQKAVDLLKEAVENKVILKDINGNGVEFLLSMAGNDNKQEILLSGTPATALDTITGIARRFPLKLRVKFLAMLAKVLNILVQEAKKDTEKEILELDPSMLNFLKATKIGKA